MARKLLVADSPMVSHIIYNNEVLITHEPAKLSIKTLLTKSSME